MVRKIYTERNRTYQGRTAHAQGPQLTSYGQPTGTHCQFLCRNILIYSWVSCLSRYLATNFGRKFAFTKGTHKSKDSLAVSVVKSNTIVGHVPANLSILFSHFLSRRCNKGTAEVTGARLNRGAGYGLKIPCKYRLYSPAAYIERLETIIRGDEFEDSDHQSIIASMP